MALEAFLKIEGIPGESRKQGHADEIDILSFSFGASNPTTVGKGTGAGASSVCTVRAPPQLRDRLSGGDHQSSR